MSAGRNVNSKSHSWGTPKKYVDAVRRFFDGTISLDPCSNEYSIVNAETEYLLPSNDGLRESWDFPTIYVNPPYGSDRERGTTIKNWLAKCVLAYEKFDSEVLALVPVAANTGHWKQSVFGKATAVCFLYDTRLKFLENGLDVGKGAPMACSIVYWGNNYEKFYDEFIKFGAVINLTHLHNEAIGKERFVMKLKLG
tara:strand:- start:1439 stop:2026 length:588 start_codon:yes stop_codon:yes gene_type:complete